MESEALVYCEREFGKIDGKDANGLARHSEKYSILGIIDSTKAGCDAGELLDGVRNGVPIFGCDKLVEILFEVFPKLANKTLSIC